MAVTASMLAGWGALGAPAAAGSSSWLLPALLGGGAIGSSLLGGLMGSQDSGDFSRKQLRKANQQSKYQAMINSELMLPYAGTGQVAAQKLWGIGPTGQATTIPPGMSSIQGGTSPSGPGASVPYLAPGDTVSGTTVGYKTYGQTAPAFDRTGGAGKYMGDLESLIKDFKFDTNDPAYRYKTEESEKSINKALAARGLFDSRPGVNMLTEADRAITAEEYDKQYNRKYGGLSDLFRMAGSLGETDYQSLLDAVKVGTGAAATAGQLGSQSAANQASVYGQMAQQGNIDDANKASLWSGLGAMPMNAMLLYNLLSK